MKQSLSIFLQDRRFGACLSLKTNLAISSLSSADKTTVFRGLFLEGGGDLISLFSRKEHTCQKATSSFDIHHSPGTTTEKTAHPFFDLSIPVALLRAKDHPNQK